MHPIERLLDIMASLRDPQTGCPWDIKQTYATVAPYTLEEAYEVADAIERGDMEELRAELGDLLFQIVFYSQIAREEGRFDFTDVVDGICAKMLRRHPHVFADAQFADDEELRHAWEAGKSAERAERSALPPSQMDGVAVALPALVRAEKLQRRAHRVGFDWPDVRGALAKTREELAEVEEALTDGDPARITDELGDMLFAMVNVVRMAGLDAEQTLAHANRKFERRFRAMEGRLLAQGVADLTALDLAALELAWQAVKADE